MAPRYPVWWSRGWRGESSVKTLRSRVSFVTDLLQNVAS